MISVGQTVGNYQVTAKLGEGGMGIVYLAEHPVIGRKVALKAIHPDLSKNPEVISRFMTEAKSVNQIGNEHIVDISDFGNTAEGEFYFVMEFLQGESLADRLRREHHFPMARALKIAAQVADALFASHSHGIIHRDLKPENIYLITRGSSDDFVKVLDFGLAKLTQGDEKVSHKTRTGSVMGTPYYMSPEQCEGKASVDHRADVYSLGVILFEMMTGKVPFGGEGYGEIIVKHITQAPPSARAINPEISSDCESILYHALAKHVDERFQDMALFRTAMLDPASFAAGAPTLTPAPFPHNDGRGTSTATVVGGVSKSIPTTFGQSAGELEDDEFEQPKSRKRLIFGVIGGVALAAVAGVMVMGGGGESPPVEKPVATVATEPEPAVPATPKTVLITFRSSPGGATVTLKATGEVIGVTPFEKAIKYGTTVTEFVFSLPGHSPKVMQAVPEMANTLDASFNTTAPTPVEPEKHHGSTKPTKTSTKPSKPDKNVKLEPPPVTTPPPKKPKRPNILDEDAVLEPSFE
ncbi:MAG: serine/threonine-protein kinase [Deltaproteobacteria bacterium]|nr:serine/threonine-protein kinase [Deltaproteobacteria bacterium]